MKTDFNFVAPVMMKYLQMNRKGIF